MAKILAEADVNDRWRAWCPFCVRFHHHNLWKEFAPRIVIVILTVHFVRPATF